MAIKKVFGIIFRFKKYFDTKRFFQSFTISYYFNQNNSLKQKKFIDTKKFFQY